MSAAPDNLPVYALMDAGPIKPPIQPGVGIWAALRESRLIGRRTRGFYQNFSFSWPGAVWGMATTLVYAYMVAVPDPALVDTFGKTTVVFLANMALFFTLCGNFAIAGSKWFLEGKALARALEQSRDTLESDPSAGSTFNANKWDFDTPLRKCRFFVKIITYMALVCAVVAVIYMLCPGMGVMVYLAAFLTFGFFFLYIQGYIYVVDLILILSVHSVMHVLLLLESDPLSLHDGYRGHRGTKFRFWRDIIERHKAMSAMFESIWEPAVWVIGPHVIVIAALGVIGLAGGLQGAKSQEGGATVIGLLTLLGSIVAMKRMLERMAFVTDMCMSSSLLQRSIASMVISRCGDCPWAPDQLAAAGYADMEQERRDQDRCMHYIAVNKTGTRIFGVLLDSTAVSRFTFISVVGFAALLLHVGGALDLGNSLLPQASLGQAWGSIHSRFSGS